MGVRFFTDHWQGNVYYQVALLTKISHTRRKPNDFAPKACSPTKTDLDFIILSKSPGISMNLDKFKDISIVYMRKTRAICFIPKNSDSLQGFFGHPKLNF